MKRNDTTKYLAAGLVVSLFLGLTVWLIHGEGRRTRESIRDAGKEVGSDVRKGIVEGAERAVDKTAEVPGKIVHDVVKEVTGEGAPVVKQAVGEAGELSHEVLGDVKDVLHGTGKPDAGTPGPVPPAKPSSSSAPQGTAPAPATTPNDSASEPPSPPAPLSSTGEGSQSPSPPAPLPKREGSQSPADPIEQLFDLGHKVTRAADEAGQEVFALSWEEEQKVGRELHAMVARDYKLLRPPAVIERLKRLTQPIIEQRTRKELAFTIEVIKSDEINSFAHAGGYVYVNTAMLAFAKADAELQFFLAHEVGHQELKHVVKKMTYAARASQVGGQAAGTLAQMAYTTIAVGYSKEQEFEADAWAFGAMLRAGRSRDEALSAMRHILTYVNGKGLEPKRGETRNPLEKTRRQVENHFRTHPPTAERLKRLEAIEISPPTAKPEHVKL